MNSTADTGGIRCENLTFRYMETSKYKVVDHADFEIGEGKVTVLTGPSGCGKSTLLYLMAGIYPQNAGIVDEGRVTIDGREMGGLYPHERARIAGMMFQNPDLQFCMDTVNGELAFCLENMGGDPAKMDEAIHEALAFCEIEHLKERAFHTLSGGEKQKVMLACAVLIRPKWLLLDEPFANIDPASARVLVEKLGRLHRERGVGIVAVDHQLAPWLPIMEEAVLLGEGARVRRRGITPGNLPEFRETFEEMGVAFPGQAYRENRKNGAPEDTVLAVRGLCAGYGGKEVLSGLDADFYRGKVHAVTGASGSGKSTLFSILCRIVPYGGSIRLEGEELKRIRKKAMAHRLGFVFQNPQDQFVAQSVYAEMEVSLKQAYEGEELETKIREYLKEIGLWRYRRMSPFMLSQGQQRRLAVAALLAYDCKVLVCDEPTYAQNARSLKSVMKLMMDRVEQKGLTLIFSTHDRELARDYADVIYTLADGKLERRELI
ncbi:ABC transporter ATP-binding protein [Christensenella intestinihominis]|uniref:ABC transporter ATP-binding protein n=1 Tax=Christensenella intestinihominis TaxID=1851429 RepID=UPI000835E793|nr:ABC transporter ATP-binding protein [Christensenella intestinihominis]